MLDSISFVTYTIRQEIVPTTSLTTVRILLIHLLVEFGAMYCAVVYRFVLDIYRK